MMYCRLFLLLLDFFYFVSSVQSKQTLYNLSVVFALEIIWRIRMSWLILKRYCKIDAELTRDRARLGSTDQRIKCWVKAKYFSSLRTIDQIQDVFVDVLLLGVKFKTVGMSCAQRQRVLKLQTTKTVLCLSTQSIYCQLVLLTSKW